MSETPYYKSDYHEKQTNFLLGKLGKPSINYDLQYGVFAYIVGATFKAENVAKAIDDEGAIDVGEVYKMMSVFSSSEKDMIRFAFQCFSSTIDDIKLSDVMFSLDDENIKVIKQAIDLLW